MTRLIAILIALLTAGVASGQSPDAARRDRTARPTPALPSHPAGAPEVVDATTAALQAGARLPGERIGPDIVARIVELPPTSRPDDDDADDGESGSLEPAGYVRPAPAGLLDAPWWIQTVDGGWVCAIELSSANALALRVRLTGRFGFDGVRLRVYDPVSGAAFGPYTKPRLDEHGDWWTTIIFGESIGLEFALPPGAEPPATLPAISAIAYIYDTPPPAGDTRGGCPHGDVTCNPSWATTADAVTMLSVIDGGGNVVGFCSGALLNRGPEDFSPLVMTANHCVGGNGGQATANSTSFVWLFQTSSCDGTAPNANNLPRSDGSLLVKRHVDSDWNLLGLYEAPGATSYAGWSTAFFEDGDGAIGIHHPGGTFKRISFGQKEDEYNQTFCLPGGSCFDAEIWEIEWTTGQTQPGSSGSPVFDTLHRVRGTLSGGPTDDCTISKYGRFDLAMDFLRYYLSSTYIASPMYVNGGVGGDPGNNGNAERGTDALPFNTVYEASYAVIAGDDMHIVPGDYNETFTIRRPMTLKRWGSSGVVRIGQ